MAAAAKAAATAAAAMHCAVVPDTPSRKLAEKAAERRSKRGSTRPADAAALEKLNGMSRGAFYARGMPPPVAGAGGKGAKANIADKDASGASAATAGEDGKAAGVVVHKGALPNAHVVGACSLHGPKGMQLLLPCTVFLKDQDRGQSTLKQQLHARSCGHVRPNAASTPAMHKTMDTDACARHSVIQEAQLPGCEEA